MADEQQILEIHKLANELAQKEYKDYTIGMYDVRCVIKAIEELTHKMYENETQEAEA
jgi:hypothetical protein